jgi:hypothetical protein
LIHWLGVYYYLWKLKWHISLQLCLCLDGGTLILWKRAEAVTAIRALHTIPAMGIFASETVVQPMKGLRICYPSSAPLAGYILRIGEIGDN